MKNINLEIWKDIPDYEGRYQASNSGKIKSLKRTVIRGRGSESIVIERILKPNIKRGYYTVGLSTQGKIKYITIHRLIAITFIPNPDNLPQVNHKDENKTNNCVDNLEWCTCLYNIQYGTGIKRHGEKRKGFIMSEEQKEKLRIANLGKKASEETKRKMSETKKGKPVIKLRKPICMINPETDEVIKIYSSQIEAAKEIGCTPTSINDNIKGRTKKCYGYKFISLKNSPTE